MELRAKINKHFQLEQKKKRIPHTMTEMADMQKKSTIKQRWTKKSHLKKRQKGQVLVETLVLLPLIYSCFILCLLFFFMYAQHLWMDHQLYQSLLCMAKGKTKPYCESQMKRKIASFLWIGELNNIQFHKRKNGWRGLFIWETEFWRIQFSKQFIMRKESLL